MTTTHASGLPFNFYASDVAKRENDAATAGFTGTRADGSTVSSSFSLDGGNSSSQNFGFAGFTTIVSLRFTGGDQLDRIVFSDLVPPPASDATVNFDNATLGTEAGWYPESSYQFNSSAPGGMGIQSTMNNHRSHSCRQLLQPPRLRHPQPTRRIRAVPTDRYRRIRHPTHLRQLLPRNLR